MPAPPLPANPFGHLGSVASEAKSPPGAVRLTLTLREKVEYVETPAAVGQGLGRAKWTRHVPGGPGVYVLTADGDDLAAAAPLSEWRAGLAADFPPGPVNRKTAGARRLAAFARSLLTATDALHASRWRLGLTGPQNLYVVERPAAGSEPSRTDVFLPDLGAAWVGDVDLAAPNWLKKDPADAALWGDEPRLTRQYAAPLHYQKAFRPDDWAELVQRDLRLVARLVRYVLAGDASAPGPTAGRCPVWDALRAAEAGTFVETDTGSAADNFKKALLDALHARPEPPPPPNGNGKPHSSRLPLILGALVLLAAGGVAGWYGYSKYKERTQVATNGGDPVVVPPVVPPGPDGRLIADIEEAWKAADNPIDRGKAAVRLAKFDRANPLVDRSRAELLDEIRKTYAVARSGGHVPLTSRELWDLYKQLPDTP